MKALLLLLLLAAPAIACDCVDCTCDPCNCSTEKQISLPADASRLYVSVYAETKAQAATLLANSTVDAYRKAGAHVNIYYKSDTMYKTRFVGTPVPSAFVQKADGSVIWASNRCPWRKDKETTPDEGDKDQEVPDKETTPVAPDEPSPWLLFAVAAAGLSVGVGSKLFEELQSE